MTQDHRAAPQPGEPGGFAAQANRMRRATDGALPAPPQQRRKSSRSVLALLAAAGMSGARPEALLWSGRNILIASLTPLLEQAAQRGAAVTLMLIRVAQPLALRVAGGPGAAEAFHLAATARLRATVRELDVVLRLADADLALVLHGCGESDAAHAAARIAQAVNGHAIDTEFGAFTADVTVGFAVAAEGFTDARRLLEDAEMALGEALNAALSSPDGGAQTARERARELVAALDAARLELALQPIVSARSRALFCFEALARLSRADGTPLPPAEIMPVAELTGLVVRLDVRMLRLAAAHLRAHPADRLSVNVSIRSLLDPAWIGAADDLLADAPSLAARLIVEITETVAIDDLSKTSAVIRRLKTLGARIAMDDFGAGHSSFKYLRDLEIDILKIDGAFVRGLPQSDDAAFVRALVSLGRQLGIATVAEWVEDEDTAALLTEWGVDYLQGHLTGAATPA